MGTPRGKFLVWNNILKTGLLPILDLLSFKEVMKWYNFYDGSQWWDRDRLLDYQLIEIRNTVREARDKFPLFRKLYKGINPERDIREIKDLEKLPILEKDMILATYPGGCTNKSTRSIREYSTSGSTGTPMKVLVDSATMSRARALMLLRATYSGWKIGIPLLQTGMSLSRGIVKGLKDKLLRTRYVSAFNLNDEALDSMLAMIEEERLEYLMGYPGSIFCLAERARTVGFNRKMVGIVTWGDNLYRHYRSSIEGQFGCRVTDTYGIGEGVQIAAQCGESNGGYHIFMPHVALEVVDDRGSLVIEEEMGNLLLTRLGAGVMPLIRYRVGDIGRKSAILECPCGRGLDILSSVDGRDTDIVVTPNGNRLIVHFFTGIFEYYDTIKVFRVVQEKEGEIVVEIVPAEGFDNSVWNRLKSEILAKGDRDLRIELKVVENITPEKSNKRRFVVSRLR